MKNFQNNKTVQVVAIIVLLIVVFVLVSKKGNNNNELTSTSTPSQTSANTETGTSGTSGTAPKVTATTPKSSSSKCNLTITYPTLGSRVSFPLVVKGVISNPDQFKGSCLWNNISPSGGTAQLFYNFNNYGWKSQGIAVPINITGGQVASTSATTVTLNFFNQGVGLPSGAPMRITFIEFNPLSAPNPDTFDMTVYLK